MAGPVLNPPSGSEKRTVRTAASFPFLATLSIDRGAFDRNGIWSSIVC